MSHSDDTTRVQGDGLFDGRYRFIEKIGQGGMAKVFLAEDVSLHRKVAIKVLGERYAEDAQFVERFQREARAAAGLNHPNIVQVYDHGRANGSYYIAMEYLEGPTLDDVIAEEGHLPARRAIDLTLQILAALRFAHRHGVVHRDVKPQNMILLRDGRVKVTDFGIARAGSSEMTEAGSIIGTAQYISPEQARGLPVGPPADLYSVGVVLYKMLTGRVPFDGESAVAVAMRHVQERPVPPSHLNPDVPPDLERVVMRALAKDVERRYQTADEMGIDLDRVRKGLGVSQQTAVVTGATRVASYAPPPPPPEQTYYREPPPLPPDDRRGGGSRWWVWLFVLLLIGAALALGYIILSGGDDDGTPARRRRRPPRRRRRRRPPSPRRRRPSRCRCRASPTCWRRTPSRRWSRPTSTPRIVRVFSEQPVGVVIAQNPQAGRGGADGHAGAAQRLQGRRGDRDAERRQPARGAGAAGADRRRAEGGGHGAAGRHRAGGRGDLAGAAGGRAGGQELDGAARGLQRAGAARGPERHQPERGRGPRGHPGRRPRGRRRGAVVEHHRGGQRDRPGSGAGDARRPGRHRAHRGLQRPGGGAGAGRHRPLARRGGGGPRGRGPAPERRRPSTSPTRTQDGLVIAQAPEAGSTAVAGDRVRINVGRFFGNTDTTPTETEPVTT